MVHSDQQDIQEFYKAAILGTNPSSKALQSVIENIKKAMESLLTPIYQDNQTKLKAAVSNFMNPMLSQEADESVKPFVEAMQNIHRDADKANEGIMKIQNTVTLLQGRGPVDPKFKDAITQQLADLIKLNKKYEKFSELLQKQAMVLGKSNLADDGQKRNLDEKLKTLHKTVLELKEQAKQKKGVVEEVEKITRPKPGN